MITPTDQELAVIAAEMGTTARSLARDLGIRYPAPTPRPATRQPRPARAARRQTLPARPRFVLQAATS